MVNLRFTDKEIRDSVGTPFAITFVFYPFHNMTFWNPNDSNITSDKVIMLDFSNVLFDFLKELKIESCVSPLHQFDIDPDISDKEVYKLPHYHVVLTLGSGGKKSIRQWFELLNPIRDFISIAPFDEGEKDLESVSRVFNQRNKVHKMRSLLRYFAHIDNPEKYQYDLCDCRCFGGFDIDNQVYSETDMLSIFREIKFYVKTNHIIDLCVLIDYCDECRSDWLFVVCNNKFQNTIYRYMRSLENKEERKAERDRLYYLESLMVERANKARLKEIIENKKNLRM